MIWLQIKQYNCNDTWTTICAETGDLYVWGKNRSACLGLGHVLDQFFPYKVSADCLLNTRKTIDTSAHVIVIYTFKSVLLLKRADSWFVTVQSMRLICHIKLSSDVALAYFVLYSYTSGLCWTGLFFWTYCRLGQSPQEGSLQVTAVQYWQCLVTELYVDYTWSIEGGFSECSSALREFIIYTVSHKKTWHFIFDYN